MVMMRKCLGVRNHITGVVSSNPAHITIKTPLAKGQWETTSPNPFPRENSTVQSLSLLLRSKSSMRRSSYGDDDYEMMMIDVC